MTTKHIETGIDGSGNTVWIVRTVFIETIPGARAHGASVIKGNYAWSETFNSKAEAKSWVKWA